MKRFQFVWWWPGWRRPTFNRFIGSLAAVYRWSYRIGPLEIRRWR